MENPFSNFQPKRCKIDTIQAYIWSDFHLRNSSKGAVYMIYKERYQQLLDKMNQYNSGEKGITRVAYTNEEQACLHAFIRLCKDENLQIHIDHCGNLIARREGSVPGLRLLSWDPI